MRKILGAIAASTLLVACPKAQDFINQAQSNTVMVSQLVASPEQSVAGHRVPAKVAATVFLGTIDPTNPTANSAAGSSGAEVHIKFSGKDLLLAEKPAGSGNYTLTSADNADLVYTAGATYEFVANKDTKIFAENVQAPEHEQIQEFHEGIFSPDFDAGFLPDGGLDYYYPDGGLMGIPDGGFNLDGGFGAFLPVTAGQSLTLHRPAADGERNLAIALVVPLDESSFEPKEPTFSNPPATPIGALNLILQPDQFKQDTVTIDGSKAWATCPPSNYVVTVTALKKGTAEGSNLFLSSTAFAGSSDGAPVHCTP